MSGLTLLSVPIGNSADITFRAFNKLKDCSVIFCEDTRVLKDLLKRLEIDYSAKRIFSFHDHSESGALEGALKLAEDEEIVYVSDAGSPVVSDPALPLTRAILERGLPLDTAPGATSCMAALELSGLPATPFHFHGFLARELSKVEDLGELMAGQYGTHIFFEGVSRVKKTMGALCRLFPDWDFVLCRELTKTHQSVHRFRGGDWSAIAEEVVEKGEFVVLVHNPNKKASPKSAVASELAQKILEEGARPKLVSKLLAELIGISPKEAYAKLKRE